jgi:methylenetetrahydrofolate dehydrogenase (NADP+) / methenyltetrahydrofolate cyclohydrolase
MTATIINGKAIAATLRAGHRARVGRLQARSGITPGLAVLLVRHDLTSEIYVNCKLRACAAAEIPSFRHNLPKSTDTDFLTDTYERVNDDPALDGVVSRRRLPSTMIAVQI